MFLQALAKWKCQYCAAEVPLFPSIDSLHGLIYVPRFCSSCGNEQAVCSNPECSNQVSSLGNNYCDPCSIMKAHKLPAPSVSSTVRLEASESGQTRRGDQSTIGDGQVRLLSLGVLSFFIHSIFLLFHINS